MDIKDIKEVYKFIADTDIVEIEVEDAKGRLRLRRGAPAGVEAQQAPAPAAPAEKKAEAKEEKKTNVKVITSPMVGTFYRAPSPEAPPFVEVGSVIKQGQHVCIIEAMKLMNEVESEFGGKIVAILVDNGQPVEYGEPLFHVE